VLNNTLEAGFGRITNQLGRMSAEMNMGFARTEAAIDRLSEEICKQLDRIANILETPRGTAARELYNNAFANYRKGFFVEALPDVQKAVEMLTADYLSWFLEGKIYAFGAGEFSNVIDLDKSIAAYTNAAKYISPDAEKSEEAKRLAAEIRFYLGLAQYAKSNELFRAGNQAESDALLSAARDSFMRSYQYSGLMLESCYNAARCKVLLGDIPGALVDLEAAIKGDALYCVKAEIESDFDAIRGDDHRLIEKMRIELYGEAAPVYKEITDGYELARQEDLTQYFEKTVQITQDVPADSNRSGITSSGVAGYGISLISKATIPLFEQSISEGFDKNLPYLDMRVRIPPYPALLNILRKGVEAVFQTEVNDDGGVTIVKYGGADTQVVIPASIGGKPVTVIGERVFEQKQLTSVVIPGSVTAIKDNAFSRNQLTNVVIPDSVKTIEGYEFSHNMLWFITIGANVDVKKWGYIDDVTEGNFDSSYNREGKKAGKYEAISEYTNGRTRWRYENMEEAEKRKQEAEKRKRENDKRNSRWTTIGLVLGLALLIGGIVLGIKYGQPFMLGIIGAVAGFVVFCAFAARGFGILALALIGGSIALGIHVGHPFIIGGIGVIIGLVIWGGVMSVYNQ
jgi:tetratricopeptide (TPR) repeat protein